MLGVAVLAAIFAHVGGYGSGVRFVAGIQPAIYAGAAVVGLGALAAAAIPAQRRRTTAVKLVADVEVGEAVPERVRVSA